jgi:DNA-binding transcriptional regulator YhcF (GntR family)
MSLPDHRDYVRIADELRSQIADGRLLAGQQVPSIAKLCLEKDSSRQTVGRSLRLLNREGLIIRVHGRGYFVCSQSGEPQGDTVSFSPTQHASMVVGGLTAAHSDTVSVLLRELVRGNPLAVAWLEMCAAMLTAQCSGCSGPLSP